MDGFELKRSVVATFERIHQFNTDERFEDLEVLWHGESAGIRMESRNRAKLFLPAIDERKNFPKSMLFKLVGFVIHELGHVWYTDSDVWDKAVNEAEKSNLLHRLINGLEDPRIELAIINSHRAANARTLLESLIQNMLAKNPDYIEADDVENYPFLLAVEGRRLNGYSIPVPNIVADSPDAEALELALHDGHRATSTAEIVKIAQRLYKSIKDRQEEEKKEEEKKEKKKGKKGEPNDQSDPQGEDQQDQQDPPSNDSGKGDKKEPIDVEPGDHIEEDMQEFKLETRRGYDNRAAVGKPVIYDFHFR